MPGLYSSSAMASKQFLSPLDTLSTAAAMLSDSDDSPCSSPRASHPQKLSINTKNLDEVDTASDDDSARPTKRRKGAAKEELSSTTSHGLLTPVSSPVEEDLDNADGVATKAGVSGKVISISKEIRNGGDATTVEVTYELSKKYANVESAVEEHFERCLALLK